MNLKNILVRFAKDEDGAVTVDWVVLTAALVGLSVGLFATFKSSPLPLANGIGSTLLTSDPTSGGGTEGTTE
ncbi:Flp family type IVb pilin [Roseitranquillus sediminis]|uniref:Flp family type IVb pilin n=1 Tax=Roseitranquillus sediminis TaxID=2809051 RepID=UPI001D0C4DD2|nr:hypothetical protein [Roseitranquillus sediminis]MBM9596363.1 hypothetical protein [Roseitranquillus sediminis]